MKLAQKAWGGEKNYITELGSSIFFYPFLILRTQKKRIGSCLTFRQPLRMVLRKLGKFWFGEKKEKKKCKRGYNFGTDYITDHSSAGGSECSALQR